MTHAAAWTEVPAVTVAAAVPRRTSRGLGRIADIGIALAALFVLWPMMLVIALALLPSGSVIFRHRRVGLNGKEFDCLKFRTMRLDARERLAELLNVNPEARAEWAIFGKLRHDPRVTRLGRVLRAFSLDELPQLLNVLRGDMVLVGPRPLTREELAEHYGDLAEVVLSVRPGVTGPWQVSGRSLTGYPRRVAMDADYARSRSFVGDIRLLLQTPLAVLGRRGAV